MCCAVTRRVCPLAMLMLGGSVHSSACDHSANTCMAGQHASHHSGPEQRPSKMPQQVSEYLKNGRPWSSVHHSMGGHERTLISEHLHEQRVLLPAINDVGGSHTLCQASRAALHPAAASPCECILV